MKKYNLVIFDVDGTLLDTSEGIISSAKYVIDKFEENVPSADIMRTYIGPPIQKSFVNTLGVTEVKANEMADCFRDQYKDYDLLKAKPYEGILEVFKQLSNEGYKLAIATYKRQDYAEKIVDYFGFTKYTSLVFGSDFEGRFNKADIIKNAIVASGVNDNAHIVMVGDTENDAVGALTIGIDFIGVTFGFGYSTENDVIGPNVVGVANKAEEIVKIITGASYED